MVESFASHWCSYFHSTKECARSLLIRRFHRCPLESTALAQVPEIVLEVVSVGIDSIVVGWDASGSGATSYVLNVTSSDGTFSVVYDAIPTSESTLEVTGLSPVTSYGFVFYGVNAFGPGDRPTFPLVLTTLIGPPLAPVDIGVVDCAADADDAAAVSCLVWWVEGDRQGTNTLSVWDLEVRVGDVNGTLLSVPVVPEYEYNKTVEGLAPGTTHVARVRGTYNSGANYTGWSPVVEFETPGGSADGSLRQLGSFYTCPSGGSGSGSLLGLEDEFSPVSAIILGVSQRWRAGRD